MKLLIFNTGSSSIKFKIYEDLKVLFEGKIKNHSEGEYLFKNSLDSNAKEMAIKQKDYEYPIDFVFDFLKSKNRLDLVENLDAVGHRIVHGGEEFSEPAYELTEDNIKKIEKYNEFAPLHNPPALKVVEQVSNVFPEVKQYGVFDTTFHLSNAKEYFLYGLPYGYYENLNVRRFGFHGTSYKYVYSRLKNLDIDINQEKVIICHLGSGSSICALENGESINHSFGFTPNENLIMSTRAGEMDYDAVNFVKRKMGLTDDEVDEVLNKQSGVLGISGYTKDMKTLIEDYDSNDRAKLAVDMYVNNIVDWISKFFVQLKGLDTLVFSGGIGAGSWTIRKMILDKLDILGIGYDGNLNIGKENVTEDLNITSEESDFDVFIIPTDEEVQIAIDIIEKIK